MSSVYEILFEVLKSCLSIGVLILIFIVIPSFILMLMKDYANEEHLSIDNSKEIENDDNNNKE